MVTSLEGIALPTGKKYSLFPGMPPKSLHIFIKSNFDGSVVTMLLGGDLEKYSIAEAEIPCRRLPPPKFCCYLTTNYSDSNKWLITALSYWEKSCQLEYLWHFPEGLLGTVFCTADEKQRWQVAESWRGVLWHAEHLANCSARFQSSKEPSSSPARSLRAEPWNFNDELWSVAGKREAFPWDLWHLVKMLCGDK